MKDYKNEEVGELKGIVSQQAEKTYLPSRFKATNHPDRPAMIILDTETNKETTVGLYAYGEVRKVLNNLFGE